MSTSGLILDQLTRSHRPVHVRFSNRPFGVKHFQTIRRCSVDVAHRLALRLHEPVQHANPDTDEASQVPCKGLLHALGVSDCAKLLIAKPF